MDELISPKYLMQLVRDVNEAIWAEYKTYKEVRYYINKWHFSDTDGWGNYSENFAIVIKENKEIDLLSTLHNVGGRILLQIAIDIGVDTPDFIPSIAAFKNDLKSDYKTAYATFDKAFKQIETHPDIAIGLANSGLESIIKEIFKDHRIKIKPKDGRTLYDLTNDLLKEFHLYPNSDMPIEIRTIGSSLLAANQNIERIRSTKTGFHGKVNEDYVVENPLYTYFIVNSVTTIGLFLKSFYRIRFPSLIVSETNNIPDDLPF
jgi:hypothetical protein